MPRGLYYLAFGALTGGISSSIYYRPWGAEARDNLELRGSFAYKGNLADDAYKTEPFFLRLSRWLVITPVNCFARFVMFALENTYVKEDQYQQHLVHIVKNRAKGKPLITISNHTSTLDDPVIFSLTLPLYMGIQPRYMRWTLCAQEYCVHRINYQSFFGSGKVMPIKRGLGIDQPLFLDFSRRVANGEWCHIFPEGGIFQHGLLGGRKKNEYREKNGRLKWGVGKLIAHAQIVPHVVPIWHTGMQNVVPQDPITHDVKKVMPNLHQDVTIRVGPEIIFDDIIEEWEKEYGPIKKFSPGARYDPTEDSLDYFKSSKKEKELYSKITRRIEGELIKLQDQAYEEIGVRPSEHPEF